MNEFPDSLVHRSGVVLTLDRSRLVFACTEDLTPANLDPILTGVDLAIDFGEDLPPLPDDTAGRGRIANTPRLFWVSDTSGAPIDQARFETLRDGLTSVLDWIGPVYRAGAAPGREGLLCPLPHVLVIQPAAGLDAAGQLALAALLASFDCVELPQISLQLNGQRYFVRLPTNPSPVYQTRDDLFANGGGLVDDVSFEHLAMMLPLAGPGEFGHPFLDQSQVDEALALLDPRDRTPIVVAVFDIGVDLQHPDLEIHPSQGINVDPPSRFATIAITTGTPIAILTPTGPELQTHGTHMAGLIGMVHDNGVGGMGVARDVLILPIAGISTEWSIPRAVNFARQNGARVINMSLGVDPANPRLPIWVLAGDPALDQAHAAGVVLCAAGGNLTTEGELAYPASHPKVIACAAWDQNQQIPMFSSPRSSLLSLAAPVLNIRTTTITGQSKDPPPILDPDYENIPSSGGTSAASAVVSGVAALLRKQFPLLSADRVRAILERTARKVGLDPYPDDRPHGTHNRTLGFGLVDAFRALDFADVRISHHAADDGTEPTPAGIPVTTTCDVVVKVTDFATPSLAFSQAPDGSSGDVVAGVTNFVYVRVRNDGPNDARNVVVNARIVPRTREPFTITDWRAVDPDHFLLPPDVSLTSVPVLAAGDTVVFKLTLFSGISTLLQAGTFAGISHSLLIEVVADNDYSHLFSSSPDGTDHERRRNNLARRDLRVVPLNLGIASPPVTAPADAPPQVTTVWALRPLDLLDLEFVLVNLVLDDKDAPTRLIRADANREALIVVEFAPQTIAEEAAFEGPSRAGDFVDIAQKGAAERLLAAEALPTLPLRHRIGGPSRLVFALPDDMDSVPYTIEGLLDWSRFLPRVAARAVSPSAAQARRPNDPIAAPSAHETAVEFPHRLVISPNERSGWRHTAHAVTHAGRTELWHTRLGVRVDGEIREDVAEDRSIRAIWSPDYRPTPSPPPSDTIPFRAALAADDRHQIVRLTSDFGIVLRRTTVGGGRARTRIIRTLYDPQPVAVDRLMLSSLGAWADFRGGWDLPDAVREREQLSIEEWQHVATQGRDHFARVVYAGFIYPSCHRASLIKTTERKVQTINGAPVAILRQRFNVLVRQPERSYDPAAYAHQGRENPFLRSIRIHIEQTPDLALPAPLPGTVASFWIADGPNPFRFPCTGIDVSGRPVDFLMGAIFVRVDDRSRLAQIDAAYRASNPDWRTSRVDNRKMTFAPATAARPESTMLDTQGLVFMAAAPVVANDATPFVPYLSEAGVRLPAVERLVAPLGAQRIQLAGAYLNGGVNAAGLFAEVLTLPALDVPAERAGGLATPNLTITALSERLGPVGGKLNDLAAGTFDPKTFFSGSARLLGGLSLSDIIDASFNDSQFPKMRTRTEDVGGVPTVVTTLSFEPGVHDAGPFKLRPGAQPPLTIDTVVRRRLEPNAEAEHTVEGTLRRFSINLVGVITIDFDTLHFRRRAQGGLEVSADLPEDAIHFAGALEWVGELQKSIPTGLFGGGLTLDVQPAGVRAGYTVGLPPIEVGILAIKNATISASVFLPFLQDQARVRFSFSERHRPFQLAVTIFGGGGFLAIAVGMDGVEIVEAALEFGGALSLNLGVASGSIEAMAGIYFKWEKLSPSGERVTIEGYLRMAGSVEVLGIITISITFYLGLSYRSDGKVRGQASVTLKVEIAFFSVSVGVTVEKSFGGSSSDPNFAQAIEPADWAEYADCFA